MRDSKERKKLTEDEWIEAGAREIEEKLDAVKIQNAFKVIEEEFDKLELPHAQRTVATELVDELLFVFKFGTFELLGVLEMAKARVLEDMYSMEVPTSESLRLVL